jgi:hypothetical protein
MSGASDIAIDTCVFFFTRALECKKILSAHHHALLEERISLSDHSGDTAPLLAISGRERKKGRWGRARVIIAYVVFLNKNRIRAEKL